MLGFEESEVLHSDNGIGYTKIQNIKKEEKSHIQNDNNTHNTNNNSTYKSLREQLRENKEKHEEEMSRKFNPFKPPRNNEYNRRNDIEWDKWHIQTQ